MKNQELENLKKQFDVVKLFHKRDGDKRSIAILVKGNAAFVGVSKCVSEDMFSRKRGRQIAIGRALLAYNIAMGKEQERETKRTEILSFSREVDPTKEDILGQIFDA
jgi:hypothetical protein